MMLMRPERETCLAFWLVAAAPSWVGESRHREAVNLVILELKTLRLGISELDFRFNGSMKIRCDPCSSCPSAVTWLTVYGGL